MKLIKLGLASLLCTGLLYAKSEQAININFKNLKISDLIKMTSKILNKNILITYKINGKVDFISNKKLYKDDVYNILLYVLETKGYTIVENNDILRVVRISDTAKYNLPVLNNSKNDKQHYQMITEVFTVNFENVDYVSSKIRHLISRSSKLVTDKESNSIIVTDFEDNIKTIKKIVNLISKDAQKTIEIIELENIKAASATTTLKSISKSVFNQKVLKEVVQILPNKDDNSIMLVGKEKNVDFLKKYIEKIDVKGSLVKRVVEVITLKNVESKNVIKIINSIIGKRKYLDVNDKPFASADDESNSIVLMGPLSEVLYLQELISKLDVDKPQVYVQARIIEVNENRARDVGVKYGLAGGHLGNDGLLTAAAGLGGEVIASSILGQSGLKIDNLKKGVALGVTLNLLKNNQAIDIVSEPSILAINNKESSIYVGETKSFQTGSTTTDGGSTNTTFKREDVGLTLKVKPRISNNEKVTLEITSIVEDAKELKSGQTNPDTSKKEVKTTAIVSNGESVIFGGYIKNTTDIIQDKIPVLGDIPLLGNLFKNDRKVNNKINLVIVITPYIIPTSKDLTFIRQQLAELRVLEDKYTKDLELRLEENKLQTKKEDLQRDKESFSIEKEEEEIIKKQEEFRKDKKAYYNKKSDVKTQKELTDEELHEQRLKEEFGI